MARRRPGKNRRGRAPMRRLMSREKRARLERLEGRPVVVPIEDVSVGDVVEFIGNGERAGTRFATVTHIHRNLRVVKMECRIRVIEKDHILWLAAVHETRILANHGPRKRGIE